MTGLDDECSADDGAAVWMRRGVWVQWRLVRCRLMGVSGSWSMVRFHCCVEWGDRCGVVAPFRRVVRHRYRGIMRRLGLEYGRSVR